MAGLCVGYPALAGYVSLRLPRSITLHRDIGDYDRRRDAIHSIPASKQRATEEYGVADLYGWSEDKARPEGAAIPRSLRWHGFTFS